VRRAETFERTLAIQPRNAAETACEIDVVESGICRRREERSRKDGHSLPILPDDIPHIALK
jgi:hypothetical protein